MINKNAVEKCENIGRDYFERLHSNKLNISFEDYSLSRNDLVAVCKNNPSIGYVGEIKVRNNASTDFKGEWLIEKDKYNAICGLAKGKGYYPIYINYFTIDNKEVIWRLDEIAEPEWHFKKCKKQTMGDARYINKLVGMLNLSQAKSIIDF